MGSTVGNILFVTYWFPPVNASASVRAWNFANRLSQMGWGIRVVTPDPALRRVVGLGNGTNGSGPSRQGGISVEKTGHHWKSLNPDQLRCPENLASYLMGGVLRRLGRRLNIDNTIGWVRPALKATARLAPQDVDLIVATGPPFTAFQVAGALAQRMGRPFVLDYRDPWNGNPHAPRGGNGRWCRVEQELLRKCAGVSVVSPSWARLLMNNFDVENEKINVITNGFDAGDFSGVHAESFGEPAIVYSGSFYPPKRVITPLFDVLGRLRMTGTPFKFHYYGPASQHVREAASQYGLADRVDDHGQVTREDVLSALKGAKLSVSITTVEDEADLATTGIVPAKVFESLACGTPLLVVCPRGSDVRQLIGESNGRSVGCFSGSQLDQMSEFIRRTLLSSRRPNPSQALFKVEWDFLSGQFHRFLSGVVDRRADEPFNPSGRRSRHE